MVVFFLQDGDPHYEHKHNMTAKGFGGGGSSAPTQHAQAPPGEIFFEMHSKVCQNFWGNWEPEIFKHNFCPSSQEDP